jgi:chromosome partitioning protein
VYRELFPRGLTALDEIDDSTPGAQPCEAHMTARDEVQNLLAGLMLPLNELAASAPPRAPNGS